MKLKSEEKVKLTLTNEEVLRLHFVIETYVELLGKYNILRGSAECRFIEELRQTLKEITP